MVKALHCAVCSGHATDYIDNDPPENYIMISVQNIKAQYVMFYYTFVFHNSVNKRLGKEEVDFKDAFGAYASRIKLVDNPFLPVTRQIERHRKIRYEFQ